MSYIPRGQTALAVNLMHNDPGRWWSAAEIAEACETDSGQVAVMLETPLRHGMVRRERDPNHARRWLYGAGDGKALEPPEDERDTDRPRQTWIPAFVAEKASGEAPKPRETETKATNPKDAIGISKAPLSCVPLGVVAELGCAMLEGAAKYGRHNYRVSGVRASVYFDATMRHLIAWWEGEDIDPESGVHHVVKAIASLAVLRDAQLQGLCTDDRPPRSEAFYARLNVLAAEIVERHAEKAPRHYTIADERGQA